MDIDSIKNINDLKRDVLEEFIKELPDEDKINLKKFLNDHPQSNAAGIFTTVRAYIFNTYFKTSPKKEKKSNTFAETLLTILSDCDENKGE